MLRLNDSRSEHVFDSWKDPALPCVLLLQPAGESLTDCGLSLQSVTHLLKLLLLDNDSETVNRDKKKLFYVKAAV